MHAVSAERTEAVAHFAEWIEKLSPCVFAPDFVKSADEGVPASANAADAGRPK